MKNRNERSSASKNTREILSSSLRNMNIHIFSADCEETAQMTSSGESSSAFFMWSSVYGAISLAFFISASSMVFLFFFPYIFVRQNVPPTIIYSYSMTVYFHVRMTSITVESGVNIITGALIPKRTEKTNNRLSQNRYMNIRPNLYNKYFPSVLCRMICSYVCESFNFFLLSDSYNIIIIT